MNRIKPKAIKRRKKKPSRRILHRAALFGMMLLSSGCYSRRLKGTQPLPEPPPQEEEIQEEGPSEDGDAMLRGIIVPVEDLDIEPDPQEELQ